jgi:hypothetical protein
MLIGLLVVFIEKLVHKIKKGAKYWELGHIVPYSQTTKRLHMQDNTCKCNLFLC